MDPINLLVGINLFVSITANFSGAKKGLKTKLSGVVSRPNTYLQKIPPNVSAITLIIIILAVFNIGTLDETYREEYLWIRITGLVIFIVFSWLQVYSYKALGKNYSQEIVIMKGHELHTDGLYSAVRHPQYLSQVLGDLGAGIALLGFVVIPIVLFIEIPLFILRAKYEESLFTKHFGEEFESYKKKSGFMIPFLG
ncbi:MAG: isoprenylcysteine carboxylmethyltransferase family protein [Melioribacteraceae bacterium]|nr:isoprenylcysteine carboxylmethyltransferase family protein [Melioribacteraceae bacterium]MCF8353865.1 isoprenylcysteine carboxylmethyltransferase family protein [Melioribacteraceae bacterium]MCF8393098.1 isoprenylcysteine carboxylmethyltransferase family protein [Melioribacteraceae bacterium]MCF8419217.1 isoprenylcysteine carboxylmethyltransferase family protein [Melioribacteraceae bacterium]